MLRMQLLPKIYCLLQATIWLVWLFVTPLIVVSVSLPYAV